MPSMFSRVNSEPMPRMLTSLTTLSSLVTKEMPGRRVASSAMLRVGRLPHSSIAVTVLMLSALRCSVMESA
jgi:hypothetical protein